MKHIQLLVIFALVLMFSCTKKGMSDFEILKEKIANKPSETGPCPVGTWYSPACGDPHGVVWTFSNNKSGSFSNKDCKGICTPMVFEFTYSMSGSTCNIVYKPLQPIVKCTGYQDSRPPTPGPASITLTCSAAGLTVTSGNGTTTFTKN